VTLRSALLGTMLAVLTFAQSAPVITSLNPSSVSAGGPTFSLFVGGTYFGSSVTVFWNNSGLATSLAPGGATATVPANLIRTPQTVQIAVASSNGVLSNTLTFTVTGSTSRFSITTQSPLPTATAGQSYSVTLAASGGKQPYTWAVSAGALPAGLSLDPNTGILSGVPTRTGSFSFTVQAMDNAQATARQNFALTVNSVPLSITTVPPLFNGTAGTPYSQTLVASGGTLPYHWSVISGTLPPGLTLDASSGILQGTPQPPPSLYSFTVQVTDNAGASASTAFSITITPTQLTITNSPVLPDTMVGVAYSQKFSATGGTAPYAWTFSGTAVPGLSLNNDTLAGTPATAGSYTFSLRVSDSSANPLSASRTFSLTVQPAALKLTTLNQLPDTKVGDSYSQQIMASGGVSPYTWSANGLPAGLNLDPASGVITGISTAAGSFAFTIRVTDSTRNSALDLYHINVALPTPPTATLTGLDATAQPATQVNLEVTVSAAYLAPIKGQLLLTFAPDSGAGDATVQFAAGGREADFTVDAGSTQPVFSGGPPALQTGTVAGTITVTMLMQSAGVDITPVPTPVLTARVERATPVITRAQLTRSSGGFSIQVTGYATSREVAQATFTFTATGGNTLQSSQVTVPVDTVFSQWYQSATIATYGSQFTMTVPFTVTGDANAVAPQSVSLTNRVGTSAAAQIQ